VSSRDARFRLDAGAPRARTEFLRRRDDAGGFRPEARPSGARLGRALDSMLSLFGLCSGRAAAREEAYAPSARPGPSARPAPVCSDPVARMRQNLAPSVLERAVHARQRGEIGRELRELKQGGAVGRVRQEMEAQRAALELRKRQETLLSPDTPSQRPVPARELAAAIRDVYSPSALTLMANMVPSLRRQGMCSPQETDFIKQVLAYLGNGKVNAMGLKHGATSITPFGQAHLFVQDALSGKQSIAFGTTGICAALSNHWLSCGKHGTDFMSDIGRDGRTYEATRNLNQPTQGREEVFNLAIAYYGEPEKRLYPATAPSDARWVNRDTPFVEKHHELRKQGVLDRGDAVLREHLLDNGLRYRSGGELREGFDAGSLDEAGFYQIAVFGPASAHAIAAHLDPEAGRYALFDPNYGEFTFAKPGDLRAFLSDLVRTRYPNLMTESRVTHLV
jgi:hypothetical protein